MVYVYRGMWMRRCFRKPHGERRRTVSMARTLHLPWSYKKKAVCTSGLRWRRSCPHRFQNRSTRQVPFFYKRLKIEPLLNRDSIRTRGPSGTSWVRTTERRHDWIFHAVRATSTSTSSTVSSVTFNCIIGYVKKSNNDDEFVHIFCIRRIHRDGSTGDINPSG